MVVVGVVVVCVVVVCVVGDVSEIVFDPSVVEGLVVLLVLGVFLPTAIKNIYIILVGSVLLIVLVLCGFIFVSFVLCLAYHCYQCLWVVNS